MHNRETKVVGAINYKINNKLLFMNTIIGWFTRHYSGKCSNPILFHRVTPLGFVTHVFVCVSPTLLAVENEMMDWTFSSSILSLLVYSMYVLTPFGLFRTNEVNHWNKLNKLRIPTGRKQTSWLCTSAAEELNQALAGTNPASGQSGTWTRHLQISSRLP